MSKQSDLRLFFGNKRKPDDDERSSEGETTIIKPTQKKDRKFISSWLEKFKWLRYEKDLMYCDTCLSAKAFTNPFTEGCSNFQNSTLTRHQDSKVHMNSVKVLQMQNMFSKVCNSAEQVKETESKEKLEEYAMQLRTVYMMAKRDLPADVFTDIMHLQNMNGLKCSYYKKTQIIMEFEQCIEKVVHSNLMQQIDESDYIGIMLDETCDISVFKKLVIYARYLINGEVAVAFLGNERVTDCTANGIETALINFLVRKGITDENVSKILGLGTDGASVMTGRLNGLGAKLKRKNSKLIQVHCVAHRLNLAASQAGKDIDYCKKYHEMIHSLYRFYSDSSVRYDRLRELQELLIGKATQMTEPTSVRWLSVESAVKKIFANYVPVYQSLESDKSASKADGLLRFISSVKFLLFTALLIDVLTVMGILSLTFQSDSVNISHIRQNVSTSKETLVSMKTGSETVTQVLSEIGGVPCAGEKSRFKDLDVKDNQQLRNEFSHLRDKYLDKLVQNLDSRFPQDELQILECFDILFNPKRFPHEVSDLVNHATDQLNTLLAHFDTYVDADRCKAHFLMFKHFVRSQKALPFDRFAKLLITEFVNEYPDIVVLAKIALIIPVSSAPCERGFSVQNSLKTKVRNRLNPERLNRLMFIKLEGPNIDKFDFLEAARVFSHGADCKK